LPFLVPIQLQDAPAADEATAIALHIADFKRVPSGPFKQERIPDLER
jgi:hypothetical protein